MFKPARRTPIYLRMAVTGVSGSGKTYTSISLAKTFAQGGKIAVISTDGAAHLYADFGFDWCKLTNNHPNSYIEAIKYVVAQGYAVLIIDSFSEEWAGPGGVLELVDQARLLGKDGWQEMRRPQAILAELMASAPIHLIATLKADEIVTTTVDAEGRPVTIKLGGKLVQSKDIPYSFDIILAMGDAPGLAPKCVVEKSRNPLLKGLTLSYPGKELAGAILAWLTQGEAIEDQNPTQPQDASPGAYLMAQAIELSATLAGHGETWDTDKCAALLGGLVDHRRSTGGVEDVDAILLDLRALKAEKLLRLIAKIWSRVSPQTPQ